MILAGIDEAGYGPLLGPLVVGCCAFEVEGDPDGELPCLWKRLRKLVSKNRLRSGKKIHVNDSKQVYNPGIGLKELERSVLAMAFASDHAGEDRGGLLGLLGHTASHALADLDGYAWYRPAAQERFPLDQEALAIQLFAKALRQEMERSATRCIYLGARVVFERQLNRMLEAMRNKSNVLFSVSAMHLDHLLRTYADRQLVIFCDRQGGRDFYGPSLRLMFEQWALEIVSEQDGRSEYRLQNAGRTVRLIFCEKAEAQCMPVALASMLSKYLREALMRRFNAFWKEHLPEIEPTAGYYGDGVRFLKDIDAKRHELGITDGQLIRSR
ncbi:MAG TPA: hypothetical protein VIL86_08085 [Tepidisphaeraceae bacterium]|jgi:hypothetical protein